MKILKDKSGMSNTMIILAIVAAIVLVMAVVVFMAPTPEEEEEDEVPPVAVAGQQTGPFTATVVDLAGEKLSAQGSTGLYAYLTSPNVYPDVYAVFEEIDTQGKLVDPYDPKQVAGSKKTAVAADGVVSFSVTAKQWLAGDTLNVGTDFGLVLLDETPTAGEYNPEVGNIKINARLTPEQAVVVSIVDGQPGYMGSEIEVAPIGVLSYFDPLTKTDNKTGYTLDVDPGALTGNDDFTINARLLVADTELRDITAYVDVEEGNISLELDDVEIALNGVKITGTGMTDISDLSTTNVLKKNAPSKTGDTLYVIEGASFDMSRINDNNMVEVEITLTDYDATLSADGLGHVNVTLVANNGYKTSEFELGTFTFTLGENVTSDYTTA